MGTLQVGMFVTLDGVLQAPGGPNEDAEGGFRFGGWQAPLVGEESGRAMMEEIGRLEALLLGRKTYNIFANYWPKQSADNPFAAKLNSVPKYVASRTLKSVAWQNSHLLKGDFVEEIQKLKKEHANLNVIGSGNLVQSLLKDNLVDRLILWVFPLLLGSGKHLFAEGTMPTALRLVDSKAFPQGAVRLTYVTAGKPTFGSMDDQGA